MEELKFILPEILPYGMEIWFVHENKVVCWYITSVDIKSWSYEEYKDYRNRTKIGNSVDYYVSPSKIYIRDKDIRKDSLLLSVIRLWKKTKQELIDTL